MSSKTEMTVQSYLSGMSLPSTSDYVSADRSGKAQMRGMVEKAQKSVMTDMTLEPVFARDAYNALNDLLGSFRTERPEKSEKDYNGMVSAYVRALRVLADSIENGTESVPGVPEGFTFDGSETTDDDLVRNYVSGLTSHKPFRNANRNDIHENIRQAFEDVEIGHFMTYGDVARKMGLPSSGAVSAAAARGDFPDNLDIQAKSGSTGAGFVKVS